MADSEESEFDKTLIIAPSARAGSKQPVPPARLVCADPSLLGDGAGREILLVDSDVTVGRGSENNVVLKADGISRMHARIFPGDGMWGVEDLKSTNGIRVNKTKVHQTWLKSGDAVEIGKVPYRFELQSAATGDAPDAKLDLDLTEAGDRTMVMSPSRRAEALGKLGSPGPAAGAASAAQRSGERKGAGTAATAAPAKAKGSNVWYWIAGIVVIVIIAVAAANLL